MPETYWDLIRSSYSRLNGTVGYFIALLSGFIAWEVNSVATIRAPIVIGSWIALGYTLWIFWDAGHEAY